MDELRTLFTAGIGLADRIEQFRRERIRKMVDGGNPAGIQHGGWLAVHLIPYSAFAQGAADLSPLAGHGIIVPPLGRDLGYNSFWNVDGYLTASPTVGAYTQIFRNGIIEGAQSGLRHGPAREGEPDRVSATGIEDDVIIFLHHQLAALKQLDIAGPFAILVSLIGVRGAAVICGRGFGRSAPPLIDRHDILFPEVQLGEAGRWHENAEVLKPVFDALWNAGGEPFSTSFDPAGKFIRSAPV